MHEKLDLIWGTKAIGDVIGKSPMAVLRLIHKGQLPARRIGGTWVISRTELAILFGVPRPPTFIA